MLVSISNVELRVRVEEQEFSNTRDEVSELPLPDALYLATICTGQRLRYAKEIETLGLFRLLVIGMWLEARFSKMKSSGRNVLG